VSVLVEDAAESITSSDIEAAASQLGRYDNSELAGAGRNGPLPSPCDASMFADWNSAA
jgi:hypothetical protein